MTRVTTTFRTSNPPGDCHWERATYFFGHSAAMTATGSADVNFANAWAQDKTTRVTGVLLPMTLVVAGVTLLSMTPCQDNQMRLLLEQR